MVATEAGRQVTAREQVITQVRSWFSGAGTERGGVADIYVGA